MSTLLTRRCPRRARGTTTLPAACTASTAATSCRATASLLPAAKSQPTARRTSTRPVSLSCSPLRSSAAQRAASACCADWLRHDNATLVGVERVGRRNCDVWLAMGGSKNYWLSERASGFPCLLDDGGYNWTMSSFQAGPFDGAIVALPPYCANARACP